MTALGFMLVGFGVLTVWSALDRTNVFDILRSFIGAPLPRRTDAGAIKGSKATTA